MAHISKFGGDYSSNGDDANTDMQEISHSICCLLGIDVTHQLSMLVGIYCLNHGIHKIDSCE